MGRLAYEEIVYFSEVGRAEDARDLRRAVPSFLGNVLLLPRGIPTKGEQDCVVAKPVTGIRAFGYVVATFLLLGSGVGLDPSLHPSFLPLLPSASTASTASTCSTASTPSTPSVLRFPHCSTLKTPLLMCPDTMEDGAWKVQAGRKHGRMEDVEEWKGMGEWRMED